MDEKWHFNYVWEKMQKRVDELEKQVYWLEDWKKKQIADQYSKQHKK